MKPTDCPMCGQYFQNDVLKQVEVRHMVAKFGPQQAKSHLNEMLESLHEANQHEDKLKGGSDAWPTPESNTH